MWTDWRWIGLVEIRDRDREWKKGDKTGWGSKVSS